MDNQGNVPEKQPENEQLNEALTEKLKQDGEKPKPLKELLNAHRVAKIVRKIYGPLEEELARSIREFFLKQRGIGVHEIHTVFSGRAKVSSDILSTHNYEQFFDLFKDPASGRRGYYFTERKIIDMTKIRDLKDLVCSAVLEKAADVREEIRKGRFTEKAAKTMIWTRPAAPEARKRLIRGMNEYFTENSVKKLLRENRNFRRLMKEIEELESIRERFQTAMIETIPDDPVDLYPMARKMKRHFILHLGPTNSGKTYDAMQALRKAGSGVYLAPLRLLAFEQYETMNADGYPCSMLTGEERIDEPGAKFQASTIEMADMKREYEMAVIDEGQMVSDESRGGSWTAAILGLLAENIAICAAEDAESLLIKLIESCHDTYEIVRHYRRTPLVIDKRRFEFPKDLEAGDAVIVFSRANVHAVAAEIRRSLKEDASVIYGALPYDVRHEEARKFASGETKIAVATDAIGMGLNLPVKRIVFLEGTKFDGHVRRPLTPPEVKQIAGRAGRFGIYDKGYVTAEQEVRDIVIDGMYRDNAPLEKAVLSFPESLLGIDVPLSKAMERWVEWEIGGFYEKEEIEEELKLVTMIEEPGADKKLLYDLATIPFDTDHLRALDIWHDMARCELEGIGYDTDDELESIRSTYREADMSEAEEAYKVCDLLYYYNEKFGNESKNPEILEVKKEISGKIIELLDSHELQERTCKICGRLLKWNHPYSVCERCFRNGRQYRDVHYRSSGHKRYGRK